MKKLKITGYDIFINPQGSCSNFETLVQLGPINLPPTKAQALIISYPPQLQSAPDQVAGFMFFQFLYLGHLWTNLLKRGTAGGSQLNQSDLTNVLLRCLCQAFSWCFEQAVLSEPYNTVWKSGVSVVDEAVGAQMC